MIERLDQVFDEGGAVEIFIGESAKLLAARAAG